MGNFLRLVQSLCLVTTFASRAVVDRRVGSKILVIDSLVQKGEGSFCESDGHCQNLTDGQLYACKTLKRHFVSVEQALGLTEVRALRRLRPHVNVVQLHDIIFDKKSGRLALIFELMDLNMYELLKARKKPLPEFRVKSYMYQLLRSLDHIHRHGIFHRDVKPENLLIRDNLLKLADFGSCRGINTKRPYTEYISTRWYRPPECLLTSGYYSHKMDMWAAGCVFFEALTNLPLFPGSSEIDQLSKIHNVLGTPKSSIIAKLRRHKRLTGVDFNFQPYQGIGIAILAPGASPEALELLVSLCSYDEDDRPSARQALKNAYFLDFRLAEKYQHSGRLSSRNTGKRTSSASKQSSPLSPRSGPVSRVDDDVSNPATRETKKHRSEQLLLLPTVEINGHGLRQEIRGSRSLGLEVVKCKTNRSVNLPPIPGKSRKKKDHRNPHQGSNVSQLPPINHPWRP
ncbi:MAPK/MAK/MRK overlapping kinase like protein [Argiope bruennichi]|uniref:MAPK/MAK/MRK overlapping kinase like protein n=1 Tax=Argiope bruennichi TaxID=94029 RepID=A0A8T0FZS6_ARGBR|nr:MAPK/MAK/MRK overlapping kinase like protein [Argiope bruennichi]